MPRWLIASLSTAVGLAAAVAAQAPQKPPPGSVTVVGRVINGKTNQPIAGAAVYVSTPEDAVASLADGRFVVRGARAGRLFVAALKAGYLQGLVGRSRYGGAWRAPQVVAENEIVTDVVIRLWPGASISGRVLDEAGEPLVHVEVRAIQVSLVAGRWTTGGPRFNDRAARTDDRGVYRIDSLPPGRWIVAVHTTSATVPTSIADMLDTWSADPVRRQLASEFRSTVTRSGAGAALPNRPTMTLGGEFLHGWGDFPTATLPGGAVYRTQYARGSASPSSAQIFELDSGDEQTGVDFTMRPVKALNISGLVVRPESYSTPVTLRLVPVGDSEETEAPPVAATIADAAGRFTFLNVPSGEYTIRTFLPPVRQYREVAVGTVTRTESIPPPADAPTYWAAHDVVVSDRDVSGVVVSLKRGVRISGRLIFEGAAADAVPPDARYELQLERSDGGLPGGAWDFRSIPIQSQQFASAEITPGRYFLTTLFAWRIVAATSGGRDALTSPIVLQEGRDVTDVVVTLKKFDDYWLTGTVTGLGPDGWNNAAVLAFPADRARWTDYGLSTHPRFFAVGVERSGAYTIPNLMPGEYFLIALAQDPGPEWMDPEQLGRWAVLATRVTVTAASAAGPTLSVRSAQASGPTADRQGSGPWVPEEPDDDQVSREIATATGAISGVVFLDDGGNKTTVRVAVVSLSCTEPRLQRTFVTDESGAFAFSGLPPCRYSLSAAKPGYVTINHGATRPERQGTPLTLASGQHARVTLTLLRGAVISGTVRSRDGEPMIQSPVQVMRYGIMNGQRQLQPLMNPQYTLFFTDARGEYRVYGLPPGEYVVGAAKTIGRTQSLRQITQQDVDAVLKASRDREKPPADPGSADASFIGYATVFFPSTPVVAEAAVLKVDAGEERSGVDIIMNLERLSRVRLDVRASNGQPPGTTQARVVTPVGYTGIISPVLMSTTTVAGGRMDLGSFPPGRYTVAVSATMQQLPQARPGEPGVGIATGPGGAVALPEWAIVPISLTGADLDLHVQLERGKTITGRVIFDGVNPPAEFKGVTLGLAGPSVTGVQLQTRPQPVSADGRFTIDSIVPATYRVIQGSPILKGWQIASAMINGQDAADRPIDISTDINDVVVTFTDKTTELSGRLLTPDARPAPDFHIIVFATDRSYWAPGYGSRRSTSIRPGTDGTFRTTTLAAGDYFIAAVTDVEQNEWAQPEFLEALVAGAVKVTLKLGERTVQDLRIR